ncbi:hypothetical protein J31TS4_07620 [Paenibacillus sp. J31TS4]|uniref:nucleotidyltransferase domain-containing protein n=1 Tax=Paenibacillus sp. J31TS4 TaxID=2807195 RepID=UPI001B06376F|nr:hypothetical protein [Paenibacillus sp. J31TS4]GIP37482.1 hypothetical protein J31TS4_07620 [Paenibacillus sp. J31TS4]
MEDAIRKALASVADRLEGADAVWMVGGSCGLLLQDVQLDRPPRDLDLYADQAGAKLVYEALAADATDKPAYSETPIYASELVHFAIEGMAVELVGGFRVMARDCRYEVSMNRLLPYASSWTGLSRPILLMPLAHELVFNWLRERPDRYERIAETMKRQGDEQTAALSALLDAGSFPPEARAELLGLLESPGGSGR